MNTVRILSTDDIPIERIEGFRSDLREDFQIELSEGRIALRSMDAPSWINLIADAEWWQQGLAAYAALYLAEIVKEAGKETWKNRARAISLLATATNKVKNLALAIKRLKSKLPEPTQVFISLPEPNEYFGARLHMSAEEPELMQLELALFIHYLPALNTLIEQHKGENTLPATGYFLEILSNGDLQVVWFDARSLEKHSIIVSLNEPAL